MKKVFCKPSITVMDIHAVLLTSSSGALVKDAKSNIANIYVGGESDEGARSRDSSGNLWDESE